MTPEEFRIALPTMPELYVIFSGLTHMPYLECNAETMDDEVFAFTDKEGAEAAAKMMKERFGKPVLVIRAENKDLLRLCGSMNLIGVTSICLSDKGEIIHVPLSYVVTERDMSNVPENQRPVTNKGLQTSLLYYLQERRNTQGEAADEETIKELEEELLVNIRRAKYYIVFAVNDNNGKEELQMMIINKDGGDPMLPIFTDFGEIERMNRKQKLRFVVADFEQVLKMTLPEQVKGYIINPATTQFPLPKDYAQKLLLIPADR